MRECEREFHDNYWLVVERELMVKHILLATCYVMKMTIVVTIMTVHILIY